MCVSSCRCCVFVSVVHPVAIISAVFCGICSFLMFVPDDSGDHIMDTACSWLVRHSRGDCRGEHCANCIHLPRLSGGPAAQFFGEASRASPQHGWRSAYSLRETLSPTQDQNQHYRPLHTHALNPPPPHSPSTLAHQSNPLETAHPPLPSPPTT